MIVDKNDLTDYLIKVKRGEIEEGLKLGIDDIDEYMRFKRGSLDFFVGHANTGKTHLVLFLMFCYSRKHKLNWLIYSSENTPYSIMRKFIEFHTGLPITKIPEDHIKTFTENFSKRFKLVDTNRIYTYTELLTTAKTIYEKWKFDGFLIDPYNSLRKDGTKNGYEYNYDAASAFRLFCKVFNVTIWINAHAVTEALRKKHAEGHTYAGHPIPPSMADAEGGGVWGNRSDNFYSIHRYTMHKSDWLYTDIHVKKCKDTSTGGKPTVIDEGIRLKSLPNQVGFLAGSTNIKANI